LQEDEEDTLFWSGNDKRGIYTTKLGYRCRQRKLSKREEMVVEVHLGPKDPYQIKILLWMAMDNKILTWDNGWKRGWCGPNRCSFVN
jgi:hypothetical protein